MTEFSTDEVVRQSLRSLVQELAMGLLPSKDDTKNDKKQRLVQAKAKGYTRSAEFLKKLYENPSRYLGKVLNNDVTMDKEMTIDTTCFMPKEQRSIIVSYLHEVGKLKPAPIRNWEMLRHYLFFFYRQFTSPEPNDEDDPSPPPFFMCEIREIVEGLMAEDATQLYLRLFALVRELILTAQHFFHVDIEYEYNTEDGYYFTYMLKYYIALSKAAEGLAPILPELENLLMRKYKINWVLFNRSLFYHYFYKKMDVKGRLKQIKKQIESVDTGSPEEILKNEILNIEDCWYMCVLKITSDRESMAVKDPEIIDRNAKMMAEHKNILKTNFWLLRSVEQKLIQDMAFLDSQLVLWVGDTVHTSEKLVNWRGQCICEDCMTVEYERGQHLPPFIRLMACKICYSGVFIGDYVNHVIIKHLPAEKKTDFVRRDTAAKEKLAARKRSVNFCRMVYETSKSDDARFKVPEKRTSDMRVSDGADAVPRDESKAQESMPEADTFRMMAATLQNMVISKAEKKGRVRPKLMNGIDEKDAWNPPKICDHLDEPSSKTIPRTHAHFNCGHSCKQEEDAQIISDNKKSCQSGCDHHKESKKCDCTYCEVFGTSVSLHSHKTSETRDRLRSRLNKRKEKSTGSSTASMLSTLSTSPYPNTTPKSTQKPSPSLSKVVTNSNKSPEKTLCRVIATRNSAVTRTVSGEREESTVSSQSKPVPPSKFENDCALDSTFSISTSSLNSIMRDQNVDNTDSRNIDDLLNYILGIKNDKVALAQKKAAKKARQRERKEQERLRLEEEKRKAEELAKEEKLRQERLRAETLPKQTAEKVACRNDKKTESKTQKDDKNTKKNNKKQIEEEEVLLEETIPAVVTIKRVVENDSTPTVTITLKGSTPDQDKLLYTLVNGYNNKEQTITTAVIDKEQPAKSKKNKGQTQPEKVTEPVINIAAKVETRKNKNEPETSKEVKVTLAVDKPILKESKSNDGNKKIKPDENINKKSKTEEKKKQTPVANNSTTENPKKTKTKQEDLSKNDAGLNMPMLRLPPGITITKVDGPVANRKVTPPAPQSPASHPLPSQNSRIPPVSKSGVIFVDTEKLIHQSASLITNKKRKKKNKKPENQQEQQKENCNGIDKSPSSMVTLKNPIFHTLQTTLANKVSDKLVPDVPVIPCCNQQASIIKNENGMVTIRSPRLQQSLANGTPIPNLLTELKPVIGPEVSTPSYVQTRHTSFSDNTNISSLNAQELLSGLPGIEITKVDKNAKTEGDAKKCQAADVSIIPTTNGNLNDKFSFDRDDWHYESVFTPKDILEDDLDAEERELEAFKRFCQQSVPPKRKEKVAHLNVKDIVLIKKNDATYI